MKYSNQDIDEKVGTWEVEPCDNPVPHVEKWAGQWFQFRQYGTTNHGKAHHSTLHMYVGKENAKKAIDKAVTTGIMEA